MQSVLARPLRQPCSVSDDEIPDKVPYLLQVELGNRVQVHHCCMEDVFAAFCHQGAYGQLLHVDVGADQGRQLRRKITDMGRLDATVIHQARHLGSKGSGQ